MNDEKLTTSKGLNTTQMKTTWKFHDGTAHVENLVNSLARYFIRYVQRGRFNKVYANATMQNRFRELDIISFSLSEGFIPITDSGTYGHFR